MGKLKEMLIQANLDLDTITTSHAEVLSHLRHVNQINTHQTQPFTDHLLVQQPA